MRKVKLYIIVVFIMIFSFSIINFVSGYFSDRVSTYIKNKATVYCSKMIEEALRNDVVNTINVNELCYFNKNNDNVITSAYINTSQVNNILALVNNNLNESMNKLSNDYLDLPIGIILSETLFNGGPIVKVKIIPVGGFQTDVVTDITEYGINNSMFEVSIKVKLLINTIVPLRKESIEVNCNIPLVMNILSYEVPRYYYNTNDVIPFANDVE